MNDLADALLHLKRLLEMLEGAAWNRRTIEEARKFLDKHDADEE